MWCRALRIGYHDQTVHTSTAMLYATTNHATAVTITAAIATFAASATAAAITPALAAYVTDATGATHAAKRAPDAQARDAQARASPPIAISRVGSDLEAAISEFKDGGSGGSTAAATAGFSRAAGP